jgi:hypothetical protein
VNPLWLGRRGSHSGQEKRQRFHGDYASKLRGQGFSGLVDGKIAHSTCAMSFSLMIAALNFRAEPAYLNTSGTADRASDKIASNSADTGVQGNGQANRLPHLLTLTHAI